MAFADSLGKTSLHDEGHPDTGEDTVPDMHVVAGYDGSPASQVAGISMYLALRMGLNAVLIQQTVLFSLVWTSNADFPPEGVG